MTANVNSFNFMALANPDFAMKQAQAQQQQAIAQQLMEQGSQQDNPNQLANPGGLVVPISPWGAAAKALEKGMGGVMAHQALANQLQAYKDLQGPQPTPLPWRSQMTPENGQLADALMTASTPSAPQGNIMDMAKVGTVTGNPNMDTTFLMTDPTEYMKALAVRNQPPDQQKLAEFATSGTSPAQTLIQGTLAKGTILPNQTYDGRTGVPIDMRTGLPLDVTPQSPMNPMLPRLVQQESGGNPNAVSPAGAQGAFQIMPATAANPGYGVQPLQGMQNGNPATAPIAEQQRFANDYLNAMQAHNGGNAQLAAAAYNAGPGAVDKALANLPRETQQYVQNVAPSAPTTRFGISPAEQQKQEALGKSQGEMTLDAQEVAQKANQMRTAVQQMIQTGEQLKQQYPNSSPDMLQAREKIGETLPFANTGVNTAYMKLGELGSTTLLPMIKTFLQGTGQVRVFEGQNFDKIASWNKDAPIESNLAKLQLLLPQIDQMEQGAMAKLNAASTGQVTPPQRPLPPISQNTVNWIIKDGKLVKQQ